MYSKEGNMGRKNNADGTVRRKRFSFLSFFLGIFIGIILVLGIIFGTVMFALTSKLDNVMKLAGVDNSVQEDGRNKYINTDKDSGGAENVLQLISKISSLASNWQGLTLAEVDALVPAAGGLVEQVRASLEQYIEINVDELKAVQFSDFGNYVQDKVLDIQPAGIVENMNGGETNKLMQLILYGVEADCVTVNGVVYPLYNDTSANAYIYNVGGSWYSAEMRDGVFVATGAAYNSYNESKTEPTGNYYFKDGEREFIDPITIRSYMDSDGLGALGKVTIAELVGEMSDDDSGELIEKILGGVTLNNLINGETDLGNVINSLEISDLVEVGTDDDIMLFFVYGITDLKRTEDGYSATYKLGEDDENVRVEVSGGKVTGIYSMNGEKLKGATVGSIADITDKIDVSVFVGVEADNKIFAYLAYGITDIRMEGNDYKANLGGDVCTLTVEDGIITAVYNETDRSYVSAASIDQLSQRINGVTDELKIKDIVDVGDNKLLNAIKDSTINDLPSAINGLGLADVVDISADNAIMAYIGYGITKVDTGAKTARLGGETVNLKIEGGAITEVTRAGGEKVTGTTINGINDRISGLMEELSLGELLGDISADNKILNALKDSTINNLSSAIDGLTINELYSDNIYSGGLKQAVNSDTDENKIKFDSSYLYYEQKDGVYKLVDEGLGKGRLNSLPSDKTVYTYGAPETVWQLLLVERPAGGNPAEKAYSVNNLGEMIENISSNLQKFTLKQLNDAGILSLSSDDLDKSVGTKKLGELTIAETVAMLSKVSSLIQ